MQPNISSLPRNLSLGKRASQWPIAFPSLFRGGFAFRRAKNGKNSDSPGQNVRPEVHFLSGRRPVNLPANPTEGLQGSIRNVTPSKLRNDAITRAATLSFSRPCLFPLDHCREHHLCFRQRRTHTQARNRTFGRYHPSTRASWRLLKRRC